MESTTATVDTAKRILSATDVAEELGVRLGHVLRWLKTGELRGSNLALKRSGRPRWRIRREAVDDFLRSREPSPPAPRQARCRRLPEGVIEFYK